MAAGSRRAASRCFFRAFVCRQPVLFLGPSRSGQHPGLRCVADGALRYADDRSGSVVGIRFSVGVRKWSASSFQGSGVVSRIDLWRVDAGVASVTGCREVVGASLSAIVSMDAFSRGCRFDRNWTFPLICTLSMRRGAEFAFRPSSYSVPFTWDIFFSFFFPPPCRPRVSRCRSGRRSSGTSAGAEAEDDLLAVELARVEQRRGELRMVHRIGVVLALHRHTGIILVTAS